MESGHEAAGRDREQNVSFASDLLETEIAQRNERKDAQESTARWIVLTAGTLMALLFALARDTGILTTEASALTRILFVATLICAAAALVCALAALWPRKYDRLGGEGLNDLNKAEFLDQPTHAVTGRVVATRIGIATSMDTNHETKASWLKWSFAALAVTLILVIAQGIVLGVDPPEAEIQGNDEYHSQ